MFSEYASRFLAQSQSRISFLQPDANNDTSSRNPSDRQRRLNPGPSRFPSSRSILQRPAMGSPYQPSASQVSQFPFASRAGNPAPLFYSATDEFREEDDEEEHEREVADFYALQRSRRQFGGSRLVDSSEVDDDDDASRGSGLGQSENSEGRASHDRLFGKGAGIRSSWKGTRSTRAKKPDSFGEREKENEENGEWDGSDKSRSKGKMVDIGLESSIGDSVEPLDHSNPGDLAIEMPPDDHPPAFQQFRRPPDAKTSFLPRETDKETAFAHPRPPSSDASSVPPTISYPPVEPPRHDPFWASLFLICLASLFATFFLVFLHTSAPDRKHPLGDTIYTTLHSSFHLLATDTLVAVIVSLLWLAILRSFVRPLVYLILIAVPIILFSFSLYPLISSYKGQWHGKSVQDRAMRWLSFIPGVIAALWTYTVYRGRHSFGRAIGILEFACRILTANPALLIVGFATLAGVVAWTWVWMGMFTRVFLGGHLSATKHMFIIDAGTWWLGVFFILVYLWTLAVGSGIQRATTAATVSQWYFHRLAIPAPTSRQVVQAALTHASSTLFGTICYSTLLSILVRLPLVVLPRRIVALVSVCAYSLIPTPIAALTNPLTLTYAAIHSQPLTISARGLSQMTFLAAASPTSTLHPRTFSTTSSRPGGGGGASSPLLPYRLAKLLLHATRFIMSLALGFGGWVSTARTLTIQSSASGGTGGVGVRGSLYAYVVGLIAGAIGWAVLGAMEGVLAGIVDAGVVCWGSERGAGGGREARYCLEAEYLFGGGRDA
ncbi:hypothetical protein L228DRAFT_249377 [Xylona heveae TC161]|uniref:Protein PNS1 n=1 Tax=Xylona heveae (strain CBS 132557 / TC161) TaxID=1328760 RepID=A0A165AK05_XYLHT|nr:hypothetical protein L228DRAFT_249377 [Xylona heveae TC161]KZF20610.1 hypothetical protein L228DRAFT_249377 [Xylona heveae TC161]